MGYHGYIRIPDLGPIVMAHGLDCRGLFMTRLPYDLSDGACSPEFCTRAGALSWLGECNSVFSGDDPSVYGGCQK